jgi:dimethylamine monooxygenase subunit A
MGLRPLDWSKWLEIDERRDEELRQKQQLLASRPDVVVATRPAGDPASAELYGRVRDWFADYAPSYLNDLAPSPGGEHPVVAAARLVQEDLCVMVRSDAWRLQAACVCFPSRWQLALKIGRTMDDIHQPIPGYRETLADPTNGVFDRLRPDRPFWRLNWTVIDQADLHQPHSPRQLSPVDINEWYFRVERQTISRLPESGAVVFTIRNYVASVGELREQPEFLEHLLTGIESAPAAMQDYKGWVGVADRLREAMA